MQKTKIVLDTLSDAAEFVSIVTSISGAIVYVTDDKGLRVNGKSLMGMLYALEFNELWCYSNIDIYNKIKKFVV